MTFSEIFSKEMVGLEQNSGLEMSHFINLSLCCHKLLDDIPSTNHKQWAAKWMSGPGVASPCSEEGWWCRRNQFATKRLYLAIAVFPSASLKSGLWWQLPKQWSGGSSWESQLSYLEGRDIALITQACLSEVGTSLPQPGPAKQMPQKLPRCESKLGHTEPTQTCLFQECLSDLLFGSHSNDTHLPLCIETSIREKK